MYLGHYNRRDDLENSTRIRDSAKAWVLGDYLDAVEFKNFAMKDLHSIYFPPKNKQPLSTIGPELVDYCCAMTPVRSKLYALTTDVLIVYWHDNKIVQYSSDNREEWDKIWDEHRDLRSDVLFLTNQKTAVRKSRDRGVEHYLEAVPSTNASAIDM
jgi:hypothetical protein